MVERFEQIDVYEPGGADMRECAEGDWVHYDDYKAISLKLDGAVKNAVMIDRARLSIAEQLEDSQRARKNLVQACEAYKEELTAARDAALAEGVRAGEMESRLDAAEKEATEAENDARQWAKQLDQQVRVNRDDKAKLLAAEGRLEDAESRLNGIKALRVEMVDLIGADLDATLQGLLWPKDVEKQLPYPGWEPGMCHYDTGKCEEPPCPGCPNANV